MEPTQDPRVKDGVSSSHGSTERERRLARLRLERQRQRDLERAKARARNRRALAALGALLLVGGLGFVATRGGGGGEATADPTPTATGFPCQYYKSATTNPIVSTLPSPPGFGTRRNATATLKTSGGTITFDLLTTDAPCATTSFAFLAAQKYFDGTTCDRLTTGGLQFLQCGSPKAGDGPGYTFPDENLAGATYPTGTVAMANDGADTNGSEFFLVYGETALPPQFVPFGRITSGLDVLQAIARAGATPEGDGVPTRPLTLTTVRTSGT